MGASGRKGLWNGPSPWVACVEATFKAMGLDAWDNSRVNALCQLLQCDVYALCAPCGEFSRVRIQSYLRKNKWPITLAVQFYKIERFRCRLQTPDRIDQLMARGYKLHD